MPIRTSIRFWMTSLALSCAQIAHAQGAAGGAGDAGGGGGRQEGIFLLEPIGNVDEIRARPGLGAMGEYFDALYPWLVGMAAATAVLMALWGGIQIIMAGSDASARSNGTNRLLISLGGLLLILLSATIMNALNPTFFR